MKDELGRKVMKESFPLGAKTYSYLTDNNDEDKKAKDTKKCIIKRKLKFEGYKNRLKAAKFENKINQLEKNQQKKMEPRNMMYLLKIPLSANDDKGIKSIDSIETYAYGTSKDLVRKKEEIKRNNIKQ